MADETGPITVSPDPRRLRERRDRVPDGWVRRRYDYLFVPAEVPQHFTESLDDLIAKLPAKGPKEAEAVLDEAKAIYEETLARIDGAERRATTLQGTVAVAASLSVAGAGLIVDADRTSDDGWRIGLALGLLGFLLCLVMCALRAAGATSRIFQFLEPGRERIVMRAAMGQRDMLVHRAAELLRASGVADEVATVKVGLLRSAAWWFRAALLVLALFGGAVGWYSVCGPAPPEPAEPSAPAKQP